MLIIFIYLTTLFIAPQLWIPPIIGLPVDVIVYPLWLLLVLMFWKENFLVLTAQDKFFLLMLLWIVLSIGIAGFREQSPDLIIYYVKWFILYKLVSSTVTTPERLRQASLMLVFFALVLAVEGVQHMSSESGLGWAGQTLGWIDASALGEKGRTRWINIFDGPGVFCVAYTVALPFLLQYLVAPFKIMVRLLAGASLCLLLSAIYFTGSRGGFLTTVAVFGLFMGIRYKVSLGRMAFAGVVIWAVFALAPSYLTTMDDESKSAKYRLAMWLEGVEMVQQNPVFGIGKGNFLNYTGKLIAHNSSVEIMGETGLPGLFFWIGLLYMGIKNIVYYVRESTDESSQAYAMALGLSVGGYIVSSMFVTLEYETLYFLVGLSAAVGFLLKEPISFTKWDFKVVACIAVGWVVGMKAFLMVYVR